jgi:hypothetical protein
MRAVEPKEENAPMTISPIRARHRFSLARFAVSLATLGGAVAACQIAPAASVDDFVGVKWGASKDEARRILLARPGVKEVEVKGKGRDRGNLAFEGGTFETWPVVRWVLAFTDERFASGHVLVKANDSAALLSRYFEMKKFLTSRYGPPNEIKENADPNEVSTSGKALRSVWLATGGSGVDVECFAGRHPAFKYLRATIEYSNKRALDVPNTVAANTAKPPAPASQATGRAVPSCSFATIKLNDGRTLQGDILSEDNEQIVLQTESLTGANLLKCTLRKSEVALVERWKRPQRLASLRALAKSLQGQIKSCREAASQAEKERMEAERKAEYYRITMSKTHGNSGTLTEYQMNARNAKTKAATAEKQKQQLEALKIAVEQKIAQVRD